MAIRLSTNIAHEKAISQLFKQQQSLYEIQEKIASGKEILKPSDNPVKMSEIVNLNQQLSQTDHYMNNIDVLENRLSLEEIALTATTNTLQRVKELITQGMSDTLDRTQRGMVAFELQERLAELAAQANSTDGQGNYLFSGFKSATEPFTKDPTGNYSYNGDQGQQFIEIAENTQLPASDSGFDLFHSFFNGNGTFTVTDPGAANTGTGVASPGSVVDQSSYVADTYTITFVTNGASELAYQVVGATTGQIIPALPAPTPANAPAFTPGQNINFNGIEITLEGIPAVGDNFEIAPSQGASLLDTVQSIITTLQLPRSTNVEKATMQNTMNQLFATLEQGFDNIVEARTRVGARLNRLDETRNLHEDFKLQTQKTLSSIEDLDLAKAATELNLRLVATEAAQQSFVRIRNLFLFNFL